MPVDWRMTRIIKPSFIGTKVITIDSLEKLIPYIDWDPFF